MSQVVTIRLDDEMYSRLEYISLAMRIRYTDACMFDSIAKKITPGTVAQAMLIASIDKLYPEYRNGKK